MSEGIMLGLNTVAQVVETIGASVLLLGFIVATGRCIREYFKVGGSQAVKNYRRALGRVILIGLELLVAATIIKTITFDPTLGGLELLGLMIVIRTALGWTTAVEMNGRWPWQRS